MLVKQNPKAPLYSTLSNIELILDATGLRYNTNNSYGTLSLGSVQTWKSITPGPTGRDFGATGVGPSSTGSPLQFIDGFINLSGGAVLTSTSAAIVFDFMSFNAVVANLKYTVHMVVKIGNESNPEWVYGLFGNNNGGSAGAKGTQTRYDDRTTSSKSNGLYTNITKGTAGFILETNPNDLITPNVPFVYTEETDMSQSAADRRKHYINGVLFAHSAVSASTAVVTSPTNPLQIGATGNNNLPCFGWVSHYIIQSGIETSGTMVAFVNSLLPFTSRKANQFYIVDESRLYINNSFLSESIYYLGVSVVRNPISANVLAVFGQWTSTGHAWHEDNKVMFRKSTDNSKNFATKAAAFDPAAGRGILDCGFFYGADGVGHGFTNTADGTGSTITPGTSKLFYFTTSDDGDNWSNQEITNIPSDGLDATFAYGNGYQSDGFYFYPVYRVNDALTSSAIYVLRWPVGGNIATDLVWKTVYSGSTYRNESTIGRTGTNSHVLVARDESTLEWRQYRTSDNWDNVTDDGDLTFGEANTVAGPARITSININHNGIVSPILACYYPVRGTAILKVIYGNPANAASGTAMWDLDTKTTIVDDTEIIHYGGIYQIDHNDGRGPTFNFLAIYTREVVSSATSTLIYFNGPTSQYARTITELGL